MGKPTKVINLFQPSLGKRELAAVQRVFDSNWIGRGKEVEAFTNELSGYLGVQPENLLLMNSCTAALFMMMDLADIGDGDEVLMPAVHFVGAANAVKASGAQPRFCDVHKGYLNVDENDLTTRINRRTKAIMALHYGGYPSNMNALRVDAEEHGLFLMEDAACSWGSSYDNQGRLGTLGDFGCWSFDAMKPLVASDGGLLYCRYPDKISEATERAYLGMDTQSGFSSHSLNEWWRFDVLYPGRRSIMNDVQAAIGRVQLQRQPEFRERRVLISNKYDECLEGIPVKTPPRYMNDLYEKDVYPYFYWIQTATRADRNNLAKHLKHNGIYTSFRYYPLHKMRMYGENDRLEGAEWAARHTLNLPLHQAMTPEEVEYIAETIGDFYG